MSHSAMEKAYHTLLEDGRLLPDAAQARMVERLGGLQRQWEAERQTSTGLFARLLGKAPRSSSQAGQGLYLWGDVGRGKSMLMDLLFNTTQIAPKTRAHYHAFMLEVHARIHQWRQAHKDDNARDPIPALADALAKEAKFLCLDEMQVTDIADAMLLGQLFTGLLERGVWVVFTSNRKPDDLYLNGLQRERFLPFIALIHQRLDVVKLASAEDYRLKQLKAMQEVYIAAPPAEARAQMDAAFARLTQDAAPQPQALEAQGRVVSVPRSHGDIARFAFADLCAKPLGAADYEAIAQNFTTVMLDDIPRLSPEKRNEAKRFVTLVDTFYEHKVKLLCAAEVPPQQLYPSGDGSFEFERTVSRLMEMQSESYLAASHKVA